MCFGIIASFIFEFDTIYGIIGGLLFGPILSPLFTSKEKIEFKFKTQPKNNKKGLTHKNNFLTKSTIYVIICM